MKVRVIGSRLYNVINATSLLCKGSRRALRSSWIFNECNLCCKIVKNCRIISLNGEKRTNSARGLYDDKTRPPHTTVLIRCDEKVYFLRLVYTPPDLSPSRFTCKVNLSNTKNVVWFFRRRNTTCKLAATEDIIMCFIKLYFGTVQLSIVSRTEWFEKLCINLIKLRWWATGLFCLERICFPGLIHCDRTWVLFLGVHIRLLHDVKFVLLLDCQIIFL